MEEFEIVEEQKKPWIDAYVECNIWCSKGDCECSVKQCSVKRAVKDFSKELLEKVERKSIESSYPFSVSNLVEIIKELTGVDLL